MLFTADPTKGFTIMLWVHFNTEQIKNRDRRGEISAEELKVWERTSSSTDNGSIDKGEQHVEQKTLKKIFAPGPVSTVRGSSPLD